jgi:hypothetical protein
LKSSNALAAHSRVAWSCGSFTRTAVAMEKKHFNFSDPAFEAGHG